ncbi:hypothetical protein [Paraburkholderia ginsengiterrae]|nr:hypothetical protein [Paraburkholderia ginsengiterrae]
MSRKKSSPTAKIRGVRIAGLGADALVDYTAFDVAEAFKVLAPLGRVGLS